MLTIYSSQSFLHSIDQKDHETFRADWEKLTVGKEEVSSELRLVKPWIRQSSESNQAVWDTTWILFLAVPQIDDDGNFVKVFGCTTVREVSLLNFVYQISPPVYERSSRVVDVLGTR